MPEMPDQLTPPAPSGPLAGLGLEPSEIGEMAQDGVI
jgi:hypothetical protein